MKVLEKFDDEEESFITFDYSQENNEAPFQRLNCTKHSGDGELNTTIEDISGDSVDIEVS